MKSIIAVATIIAMSTSAMAEDTNWHLLTKSHEGTVGLIKNLSKKQCDFMSNRLLGLPATEEEARVERERYDRALPPCPGEQPEFDEWLKEHPTAQGCRSSSGMMSWSGMSKRPMEMAECFQ